MRDDFAAVLHRQPCARDELVYELSVALAKAYWDLRPTLKPGPLRVKTAELPDVTIVEC